MEYNRYSIPCAVLWANKEKNRFEKNSKIIPY